MFEIQGKSSNETKDSQIVELKETIYYWSNECEKQKAHSVELMRLFQERDTQMQAAWKAYKERELFFQSIIGKIHAFTEDVTAMATPLPESYLNWTL